MLYRCIVVSTLLVGIPIIGAQESATTPTVTASIKLDCFYYAKDDGVSRVEAKCYYGRGGYSVRRYSYASKSDTFIGGAEAQPMYEALRSEHAAQISMQASNYIQRFTEYKMGSITSKCMPIDSREVLLNRLRNIRDTKWVSPNSTFIGDPLEHTRWQSIDNVTYAEQQSSVERKGKALLNLVAQNSQLSAKIPVAPMD